jgi:hypothetical protein
MSEAKKNEYAYPVNIIDLTLPRGVTLRDYFAAAAITGLLATNPEEVYAVTADNAYSVADRMLQARATQ